MGLSIGMGGSVLKKGRVYPSEGVGLSVDVPAEEVVLHQHVLDPLLQGPLLLLLQSQTGVM